MFCVVGTFAINNSLFEVCVMLVAGLVAYVLEQNRFPIAPAILGVVLGGMLEENFITPMIKSDGNLMAFVSRPIAATLAAVTLLVWLRLPCWRPCATARRKPRFKAALRAGSHRTDSPTLPTLPALP